MDHIDVSGTRVGGPMPEPPAGEHLWISVAAYRVADPSSTRFVLDHENLLTIAGPLCHVCARAWSPETAAAVCPGRAL